MSELEPTPHDAQRQAVMRQLWEAYGRWVRSQVGHDRSALAFLRWYETRLRTEQGGS